MLKDILHIGLTVQNLEKSIEFYRDILGLKLTGQMIMQGKETDALFNMENIKVKIAYLQGGDNMHCPPVELLEFENITIQKPVLTLNSISVSEICFRVENIEKEYDRLKNLDVQFISSPQLFDMTEQGFGKSKAVYFYDNNGIILELIETIE